MNKIELYKSELKKEVSEHRFIHSVKVAETAVKLAELYGVDPIKAQVAGLIHDFTKDWSKDKLERLILESDELEKDILDYSHILWHGPVASVVIQDRLNINDDEIIQAVKYHTSGRKNMSKLEKVVCLADYIEPNRDFPGVNAIREVAEIDLNRALLVAIDGTIKSLIEKRAKIYPLALDARNYLIDDMEREEGGQK